MIPPTTTTAIGRWGSLPCDIAAGRRSRGASIAVISTAQPLARGDGNIKHVWKQGGNEVWTATLPVGSKLWAAMSRRTIPAAGSWQVDVQNEAGAQLGTMSFTIQ